MKVKIGIVGYGFVGSTIHKCLNNNEFKLIDPILDTNIDDLIDFDPNFVFVCLPTPANDDHKLIKDTLIKLSNILPDTVIILKSSVLPDFFNNLDIKNLVFNPEFLSRKTAVQDFKQSFLHVVAGERINDLLSLYKNNGIELTNIMKTDFKTASLIKFTFNTFYATKITFFNHIFKICLKNNINYEDIKTAVSYNPNISDSQTDVPGWEGFGFSGPCLPKDIKLLADKFDDDFFKLIYEDNKRTRNE